MQKRTWTVQLCPYPVMIDIDVLRDASILIVDDQQANVLLLERMRVAAEGDLCGGEFTALARERRQTPVPAAVPAPPPLTGRVSNIPDDHFGFIRGDDGSMHHFRIRVWRSATWPEPGDRVAFALTVGPDGRPTAAWVRATA